jgi:hypothetical protein
MMVASPTASLPPRLNPLGRVEYCLANIDQNDIAEHRST